MGSNQISGKDLERVLKALANRRRLAILHFLRRKKEASVGDITDEIKLSFRSTSKHLAVLSAAGIVDREQRSTHIFYKLSSDLPPPTRSVVSLV